MKTESQTVLPPLVLDGTVQTEPLTQTTVEVQVDIKKDQRSAGTQTIKQENQEIAMPNRPTSSGSKPSKKRKLLSNQSQPLNSVEIMLPTDTPPIASVAGSFRIAV